LTFTTCVYILNLLKCFIEHVCVFCSRKAITFLFGFWVQYVDTVHQSDKLIIWSYRWCAEKNDTKNWYGKHLFMSQNKKKKSRLLKKG